MSEDEDIKRLAYLYGKAFRSGNPASVEFRYCDGSCSAENAGLSEGAVVKVEGQRGMILGMASHALVLLDDGKKKIFRLCDMEEVK